MKYIKQHKCMLISIIIGIIISPIIYLIFINTIKLTEFEIINFNQNIDEYQNFNKLSWTKSINAEKYQVIVYDENLKILKVLETKDTNIYLNNISATNNKKIYININAIDSVKNKKAINNKNYSIIWKAPTLDINDNMIIYNNNDLDINVLYKENLIGYYYELLKDDTLIYKGDIFNNKFSIPKEYISTLFGKYELRLCKNIDDVKMIVSRRTINISVPNISNIEMIYPKNNSKIEWDDFKIEFTGGDNAVNYYLTLTNSNGKKILDNKKINDKNYEVLINKLKENKKYTLEIMASNPLDKSVSKVKKIRFETLNKSKTKNVESNTPNGNVTWGKLIALTSQTKDAQIYYTIDGSEPSTNSTLYKEPIKINSRIIIKAIAVRKNMNNSEVTEFKYSPIAYGMGSSNSWAPIALYNEGYLPIRYYNQRTGGYSYNTYGPVNNDWDSGFPATIASHGCGPTALATVISTLTEKDINPATITDWACKNEYCTPTGTLGKLMEVYPKKYQLSVQYVTKDGSDRVKETLKTQESLVIASMGKGTFTSTAHYIVLRGITEDNKVLIADPNSLEKSKEFWDFDLILKEVKEPYFYIISK